MELRQVIYFIAVAEELHFGRAAKRVNIAQPALSQQIIRMEQELGGRLFLRNKRSVSLTDAGKAFLPEAKLLLSQADHAQQTAKSAFSGEVGELVLGFVESAAWDVLPKVLRQYREQYPNVKITLLQRNTADQVKEIQSGHMHIGIAGLPIDDPHLSVHIVRKEPIVAALPKDHRLAEKEKLYASDLAHEPFVTTVRENSNQYFDTMVKVCMDAGFSPAIVQEANEIQTVLALVSSGMGVALTHDSAKHLRNDIVYKTLCGTQLNGYQMSFVWKEQADKAIINRFLEVVRQLFPYQD